jgi:hypothetical protein
VLLLHLLLHVVLSVLQECSCQSARHADDAPPAPMPPSITVPDPPHPPLSPHPCTHTLGYAQLPATPAFFSTPCIH